MKSIPKIAELLAYERYSAKDDIRKVQEEFAKEHFCNFLEWNRIELAVEAEIRLQLVEHFIDYMSAHPPIPVRNNIEHIAELAIDRLTGEGFMASQGPWDESSTSPGSNRLAVIKANLLRWRIGLANKLMKYFDEWQNNQPK